MAGPVQRAAAGASRRNEQRQLWPVHRHHYTNGPAARPCTALGLSIPDLSRHPFEFINNIVRRYSEFLELLEWAGWT